MLKWMLLIQQFNLKRGRYSQVVRDYLQVTFSGQKWCVDKLGLLFQSNAIRNQQVAAVCWLALSPHSKKVLTGFSPGLRGPSLGTPATSHSPGTCMLD